MFFKRIVLHNVRSIQELELSFVTPDDDIRKWTLLLGENGCGKSTLLRGIALLVAGSEALPELLGPRPESWIRLGQSACTLQADLVTAEGKERHVELTIRRGHKVRDIFLHNQAALDELDDALEHSSRNYLTIGYGVSRRLNSEQTTTTSAGSTFRNLRAQSVATMFSPDATLNPLESWAMDLDYRRGKEGLEIVKNALGDLLPGVEFEGIDKEQRQLMFRTADGLLPLTLLSDGYQNVAAWCGDLLYRITQAFADYKNPFSARGLLLIDELDLHLHPLWKRQLVDFLTKKLPHFQIVATTHSALTVHQAGEGELFVLRREKPASSPTLYAYPGTPRNLMLHQLLLSPIFGLTTVDSKPVEAMREEYKTLRAKSRSALSQSERRRLDDLRRELEDMPDWSTESAHDRKQLALLEDIQQALQTSSSTAQRSGQTRKPGSSRGK